MTVDIRATVTCSLGTLINASVNDDYIQQSGLVKTRGSVEITGLSAPAIGTAVTFTYTKGGTTYTFPRKLRVLSSFADPYRRTTKVELGCKLTYMEDVKEPVDWTLFDDPSNSSLTEADAERAPLHFKASSLMNQCLTEIGITASSNPLTNRFTQFETFDFSSGYVSILSDLLVSESYFGYLDQNEVLQVVYLPQAGGTATVIDKNDLIDIGEINSGELPGDAVTVRYSGWRSDQNDGDNAPSGALGGSLYSNFTQSVSENRTVIPVRYTNALGNNVTINFPSIQITTEVTQPDSNVLPFGTIAEARRISSRTVTEEASLVAVAGAIVSEFLRNGLTVSNQLITSRQEEKVTYNVRGEEILREVTRYKSWTHALGTVSLPLVFSVNPADYVIPVRAGVEYIDEKIVVETQRATTTGTIDIPPHSYVKRITKRFGPWMKTLSGQQTIAESRGSFASATEVADFVEFAMTGLYLLDTTINTERSNNTGQLLPNPSAFSRDELGEGYSESAEMVLAQGSPTAQRRIEFTMPYNANDYYTKSGSAYVMARSDAASKARTYGIVQNRLFIGNRVGMNIQTSPETIPNNPFDPIVLQEGGISALYRNNGLSWTMNDEGIVISSDLIFWGAVGGTGTTWFPVAPGVVTLPTTPPVVSGQMTVTNTVPAYNVSLSLAPTVKTGVTVTSYPYALTSQTSVSLSVKTRLVLVTSATATAPTFQLVVPVPAIQTAPPSVNVPTPVFTLTVPTPTITTT